MGLGIRQNCFRWHSFKSFDDVVSELCPNCRRSLSFLECKGGCFEFFDHFSPGERSKVSTAFS